MCLVSFIVPVYNLAKEELVKCISSLVNQSFSDHEIIIVDDGSNNGIEHFCDTLGEQYGITVIHQQNQGLAVARNTGMNVAKGEWIVHVDGDDWVDLELIQVIRDNCQATDADIIVWGFVIDNGKRTQKLLLKNKTAFDAAYNDIKESILCSILGDDDSFASIALNTSWGKAYRRAFLRRNQLFYDSSLRRAQDAVYNLYAFYHANAVKYIDKALNYYRTSNASLSRSYNPKTFNYLQLTALAVQRFVSENDVSLIVKDAASIFIERCFRMINAQYYQHRENPQSFRERKALFLSGIETEPFKSAFLNSHSRSGAINKITDYLYKHKSFFAIAVFNSFIRFVGQARNCIASLMH